MMPRMKLGLMVGYSGATVDFPIQLVTLAERLGYDSVWTSEAYGSDAITPLAWIAAQTSRIKLGTAIMQVAGRPPAMCAMQAMTVDGLAGGGRMIVGLGVSGPQIVEGWYGQPWGKPYWRVRDYIEIMRKIFRREGPVSHDGREISLPYTGDGATGLGKPLRSIIHQTHRIPIWSCRSSHQVAPASASGSIRSRALAGSPGLTPPSTISNGPSCSVRCRRT
jgi:alkanesulfonate monooxygenase SsuD/methylene tetrahydromethanopterin reductase-like flavin-dependent oxidoreductase (luciferase family)